MIFFIVAKVDVEGIPRPVVPVSFTVPRFQAPVGLNDADLCFISWMEVYPSIAALLDAVLRAAVLDPVCRGMMGTLEADTGLGLLRRAFLSSPSRMRRTAALFWEVLEPWCDPRNGNPQSPTPAPQDALKLAGMWSDFFNLGPESRPAMLDYLKAQKGVYRQSPARRAQVRAFHNIIDLARAVLGEVTTQPVKRLDKILALKLCQSRKLVARQRALISIYWRRNGKALLEKVGKSEATMLGTQYLRYYFGVALSKEIDGSPKQVKAALEALIAVALDESPAPSEDASTTQRCVAIFRRLPPAVRCTMLFNDLRKWMESKEHQTFVRASLVFANDPQPDSQGIPRVWPLAYRAVDPGGAPPVYPKNKVTFLRAWNPDEHAPYAITYRMNLCPLWAGPSGHTVNALIHWTDALGPEAPADTASVVACSLFLFWRLYYDKRVSAAHTLTETFEATLVAALEKSVRGTSLKEGFRIAPAPDKSLSRSSGPPDFGDIYDLVQACGLKEKPARGAIHPIGLVRTMFRSLWRGGGFAGYDDLKFRIDEERDRLTDGGRYVLQQWSHDGSTNSGIAVKSYERSEDEDLRPIPLELGELAMKELGPLFEGIRDAEEEVLGPNGAPWVRLGQVLQDVLKIPESREAREQERRKRLHEHLETLATRLTTLSKTLHDGAFWELEKAPEDALGDTGELIERLLTQVRQCNALGSKTGLEWLTTALDQLERGLLRLHLALARVMRSSSPLLPELSQTRLNVLSEELKQGWTQVRVVLPPRPGTSLRLPPSLPGSVKRVRARAVAFVESLEILLGNLAKDLRGKSLGSHLPKTSCAEILELWRHCKEDAAFLRNFAGQTFRENGVSARLSDDYLELFVRQFARALPERLDCIIGILQERHDLHSSKGALRRELGIYLSQLKGKRASARAVGAELQPTPWKIPSERLVPPQSIVQPNPTSRSSSGSTDSRGPRSSESREHHVPFPKPPKWLYTGPSDEDSDTHWYTGDEIRVLLRLYLRDQREHVYIMDGIDAHLHQGQTLADNLHQATAAVFDTMAQTILVPVHVGGDHWTAMSIHFDLTHEAPYQSPTIVYADPQGRRDMPGTLRTFLETEYPRATFLAASTRVYQPPGDGHNCGPWTVALLEHLATHEGELPALGSIPITQRRRDDSLRILGAL